MTGYVIFVPYYMLAKIQMISRSHTIVTTWLAWSLLSGYVVLFMYI